MSGGKKKYTYLNKPAAKTGNQLKRLVHDIFMGSLINIVQFIGNLKTRQSGLPFPNIHYVIMAMHLTVAFVRCFGGVSLNKMTSDENFAEKHLAKINFLLREFFRGYINEELSICETDNTLKVYFPEWNCFI